MASSQRRPGKLLNIPKGTWQPPTTKNYPATEIHSAEVKKPWFTRTISFLQFRPLKQLWLQIGFIFIGWCLTQTCLAGFGDCALSPTSGFPDSWPLLIQTFGLALSSLPLNQQISMCWLPLTMLPAPQLPGFPTQLTGFPSPSLLLVSFIYCCPWLSCIILRKYD